MNKEECVECSSTKKKLILYNGSYYCEEHLPKKIKDKRKKNKIDPFVKLIDNETKGGL